ncbi:hypothetical protein EV44_g3772 [Erysiphe necator]|uniref:Integrase catalytic domain-containing protein n=1 Tax=Uncinula necator TaxID=52586 RepID=A0A0B1NW42_UNCNE|nr:hypothetical protein EV44_g3772 [Erysiphe necator]
MILVKELRILQLSLDPDYRSDKHLRLKLINACQNIKACQLACFKPSDTLSCLINDLQSSISTTEENKQEEAKRNFKKKLLQRFDDNTNNCIAELEGHPDETDSKESNLEFEFDTLILEKNMTTEDKEEILDVEETFSTSVGSLEESRDIFLNLADNSFINAITGKDPTASANEVDTDPKTFITTGRYSDSYFYGIVIDTGASRYSIAGHKQFLALKKISNVYLNTTNEYRGAPNRFKFNLKDLDLQFNHLILVDIMYIDNNPVLHIVDEATNFQAARWLKNFSAKHTWDAIRACWIDTYIGPPNCIVADAAKNFVSKEFHHNASSMAISMKNVPVEAHWSIGKVERYHSCIRRAYKIIVEELHGTGANKDCMLQMAVKALNDTAGPNGPVPTLLVFGAYPKMTVSDPPLPSVVQRANAIKKSMQEINKLRAKYYVNAALNHRNGPNTSSLHDLPINSDVLVWQEGSAGHSGKWDGPFKLIQITNENCKVNLPSGPTNFHSTSVRLYYQLENDYQQAGDEQVNAETVTNDEVTAPRRNEQRSCNLPLRYRDTPNLVVFFKSDETICQTSFEKSRQKEIQGLLEKGVFEYVRLSDIPLGTRIFNSRFVDEVKNKGTDKAFEKSRLVVQAFNNKGKDFVLTQSPTIQRVSQRVILALTVTL